MSRPVLQMKVPPRTRPSVSTHLVGEPAEFTVVENSVVRVHLDDTSIGFQLKDAGRQTEWVHARLIFPDGRPAWPLMTTVGRDPIQLEWRVR